MFLLTDDKLRYKGHWSVWFAISLEDTGRFFAEFVVTYREDGGDEVVLGCYDGASSVPDFVVRGLVKQCKEMGHINPSEARLFIDLMYYETYQRVDDR